LGTSCGCQGSRCEQHGDFVEFFHGYPLCESRRQLRVSLNRSRLKFHPQTLNWILPQAITCIGNAKLLHELKPQYAQLCCHNET
jgi:hypothetical protein